MTPRETALLTAASELQAFLKKFAGLDGSLKISADNVFTANGYADKCIKLTNAIDAYEEQQS